MENITRLKPIIQWDYITLTTLLTFISFIVALVSMMVFDTTVQEYFAEPIAGIERFGSVGFVFCFILLFPFIEEFLGRTVAVSVGEQLSSPIWLTGLFSAISTMSLKVYMFGSPVLHFVIGLILYGLYLKHRSLSTNIFYSGLLNGLILLTLFTFTQIPSPAV
ncbi:CPBP family glutamic-type intramembrane protease [Psychrosphaera aestuarii]|uniref:CPBP family glutamic-type intramembrane protease n=1 Tax=Psychrosphaera aestuarii TaxID=1266052 RepID=UPI001B3399ED|nr:CPBP family glutamic-type intramembrane protease [Psychrosphaera aestuarii]